MRVSRSLFSRYLLSGLVCLSLGAGGCKNNDTSGSGGSGSTGGTGGTTASTTTNAAEQNTSGDEILVGEYASMTGDTSTFGTQSDAGVKYAIEELNAAGGVLGKKFKVELQDDQSKPDEAKTVAQRFASDKNMVAVIGEVASTRSKIAAPEFQRAGIPMISPSSTNPEVTQVGDFIFRVCFIDPFQGYVMAKFAREDLKAGKVAIMREQSSDYSVGLADVFKDEFTKMGGQITADVSYNSKDSDFRSQLTQLKDVDAIFIPGYYNNIGTIARQAREQGIKVPLLGGDGWDSDKLVAGAGGAGGALEGSYFSTHYSPDDKSARVQDFVKKYKEKHNGETPAALVAQGYDAMMLLADAIKRANSTDRQKVRDALAETKNYEAVTGMITLDENRNATKSAVVLQIKGDKFVFAKSVAPAGSAAAAKTASAP